MIKRNRLRKAWQRNWEFYMVKGVYFCMDTSVKYWPTPKQLSKYLKRESLALREVCEAGA